MGLRGTGTAELVFTGCRAPASSVLGTEGDGFLIAMAVLDEARIGGAAAAVGIAGGALGGLMAYAKKRVLFPKTLSKVQSIPCLVPDIAEKISSGRRLSYKRA